MHQNATTLQIVVQQRAIAEPIDDIRGVWRGQDRLKRIARHRRSRTGGSREKMQIVIAENDGGAVAQIDDPAEDVQRIRSAINEVADEPQFVRTGIERNGIEQFPELPTASLNVADRIKRHECCPGRKTVRF